MPMATIPFCSSAVLISHKRSPAAYRALREARCEFAAQIAHAATLRLKAHQVGSSKAATRPYVELPEGSFLNQNFEEPAARRFICFYSFILSFRCEKAL